MTPLEQFIFVEEIMRPATPFPLPHHGVCRSHAGRARQRLDQRELVPKILAGDLLIAIGYSNPAPARTWRA